MYSVSRKNWAKIAPPISRPLTFEAVSVRFRKMRSGSSGAFERSSIRKKAPISPADAAGKPNVGPGGGTPLARAKQADSGTGRPSVLARARQRLHQQHQPGRDRGRTGEVEPAM